MKPPSSARLWVIRTIAGISLASFLTASCTSGHQVLKYRTSTIRTENLIPGIEPEESINKIRVTVVGKGLAPETGSPQQQKMMAERAAVIDGYRQISERLAGAIVRVYSEAGMQTISKDRIVSETNAYLRGARISDTGYENGTATARIDVFISPREVKFYHGSQLSRALIGALAGASMGALAGGAAGVLTNSTDDVIYQTMGVAAAAGAAGGALVSTQ